MRKEAQESRPEFNEFSGRISWKVRNVWIESLDRRVRKNAWTKNMEEYAVIHVAFEDCFDEKKLMENFKKKHKSITLMCFLPNIYERLVVGDRFSFEGFISLGYGNTFLVVLSARDDLQFFVNHEDSVYFANYSPKIE